MPISVDDLNDMPLGSRISGVLGECDYCGDRFIGRSGASFCCDACRVSAHREQHEAAAAYAKEQAANALTLSIVEVFTPGLSGDQEKAAEFISSNLSADEMAAIWRDRPDHLPPGRFPLDKIAALCIKRTSRAARPEAPDE